MMEPFVPHEPTGTSCAGKGQRQNFPPTASGNHAPLTTQQQQSTDCAQFLFIQTFQMPLSSPTARSDKTKLSYGSSMHMKGTVEKRKGTLLISPPTMPLSCPIRFIWNKMDGGDFVWNRTQFIGTALQPIENVWSLEPLWVAQKTDSR